ncbi:hypothetical protein NITGR_260034 [Nitrospina gracilis 3/211]|uniref:Uncharacterized protein n=1 Tax=Nitrospina gracilis (strain 3/211) TaxID=1266370 RepID=M1YYA0_NITG3|nr:MULTISPECIES: hypothetical protein [Nitrospina]MCF8723185.1 hypothetical protein [Nitrospina sp. Nb-3]CCQ90229.1 hypothetical protein NITGR_260034 [Nitrospina gracilis 3/211]
MTFRYEPTPDHLGYLIDQLKELQARQELLDRIAAQQEKHERARRRFDRLPEELAQRK